MPACARVPPSCVRRVASQLAQQYKQRRLTLSDLNDKAMEVLAEEIQDMGLDTLAVQRVFPHGVSHHLGLDVHDCDQAADAPIDDGFVFTIEPGL